MAASEKEYRKLPGRGTRFEGARWIAGVRKTCRLYLASDHLLLLFSAGFNEDFKRFYFRDIQSITIRRTNTGRYLNLVLWTLAAVFALIALGVEDPVGAGVLYALAAPLGIGGLLNTIWGPTCITDLKTAVQVEELSSLKRLRAAQKVLAIVRPLIADAQGTLTGEEIQAQNERLVQGGASPLRVSSPGVFSETTQPSSGRVHQVMFAVLLVDAVLNLIHLVYHPLALIIVETMVSLAGAVMVIWGLIVQHRAALPSGLRKITWATLIYLVVNYCISCTEGIVIAMQNPDVAQNQWEMLRYVAQLAPAETLWLFCHLIFVAVCSGVLGSMGLISVIRYRRAQVGSSTERPVIPSNTGTAA